MKLFLWRRIDQCTRNEHSEGGVVVVAETVERARELAAQYCDDYELGHAPGHCQIRPDELPDAVYDVPGREEAVYLFPDKGCC